MDDVEGVFARVLDQIVDYTAAGTTVHLVGPRGSGRSEILRLAADRLDDAGSAILQLNGNPAWRHEPYSALSAAGIGPASAPGPRRSPGEMAAAVVQQLRGHVVVLCDDADDVDPHSVGALLAAHRQRGLVAITSSRPHHPPDPESLTLGLTPAVRIKAPLLGLEQVHELVRRRLGGPVDPGTLARITMKSGGLYGLAAAMTSVGRRAGALVERSGVWTAPGDLWTEHLATVVEPFLAGADEVLWNGATTLALTGPVPLDHAERLIERADLDRLFASGLVHHLTHECRTLVGVYPPLLAEFLRREGSAFELARAAELIDLPAARAQWDPIEAGGPDAAVRNLALVRMSTDRAEAARAIWSASPTPEHAVPLIDALRFSGASSVEIDEVIAATRTRPDAVDSEAAAQYACTVATWRAIALNDLPGALDVLDAAAPGLPSHAAMLRATRGHLTLLRDRAPELDPATDPIVRIGVLVAAGRVDDARALLAEFVPRWQNGNLQAAIYSGLCDVLAGDLEHGIEHAYRQLNIARKVVDPYHILGSAYVAVFGLFMAGRLADAAHLVQRTLSATVIASYRELLHTAILVWGAEVAISQGRPEQGRILSAQALATDRGTGPFPEWFPRYLPGSTPTRRVTTRHSYGRFRWTGSSAATRRVPFSSRSWPSNAMSTRKPPTASRLQPPRCKGASYLPRVPTCPRSPLVTRTYSQRHAMPSTRPAPCSTPYAPRSAGRC